MKLETKIEELKKDNKKLLLVIGQPGSGKSKLLREYSEETGDPIVDVDKLFAHVPADKILKEMKDFLANYHHEVLLLDRKNLIINSSVDLLEFLKELSKEVFIVTTWNGKVEDGQLFHFNKNNEDLIYSVDQDSFSYILC